MYAEIPAKEADKLGPMIQVDRTYVIARFKVCNAKKKIQICPRSLYARIHLPYQN